MKTSGKGIHHITLLGGDGQRTTDFYVKTLGLRMIMKTVNQDDPSVYHLFYVNGASHTGSSITFFPWPAATQGKPGTGQATSISFTVPRNSTLYWAERLAAEGIDFEGPFMRFGKEVIAFRDPDRMQLELVFDEAADPIPAWEEGTVPAEHGIRGFWGTMMELTDTAATGEILESVFGFKKTGSEESMTLYQTGEAAGGAVILKKNDYKPGVSGRGVVHHVAFRARDKDEQDRMRSKIMTRGLMPSPMIDRHFFKSVYFRSPGGVLFEIATDGPGYDAVQSEEELGEKLWLPSELESRREMIEKRLAPVTA